MHVTFIKAGKSSGDDRCRDAHAAKQTTMKLIAWYGPKITFNWKFEFDCILTAAAVGCINILHSQRFHVSCNVLHSVPLAQKRYRSAEHVFCPFLSFLTKILRDCRSDVVLDGCFLRSPTFSSLFHSLAAVKTK